MTVLPTLLWRRATSYALTQKRYTKKPSDTFLLSARHTRTAAATSRTKAVDSYKPIRYAPGTRE